MYPEGWSDHWVSTGVCHVYFHVNQLDFSLHLLNNWSLATVSFSRAVKRGRDIPRWQRCVKSQRWCIDSKEWQQKFISIVVSTSFFYFSLPTAVEICDNSPSVNRISSSKCLDVFPFWQIAGLGCGRDQCTTNGKKARADRGTWHTRNWFNGTPREGWIIQVTTRPLYETSTRFFLCAMFGGGNSKVE